MESNPLLPQPSGYIVPGLLLAGFVVVAVVAVLITLRSQRRH